MILRKVWKQTILTTSWRNLKSVKRYCQSLGDGMELGEIVRHLEKFAPLSLAENWDNVGLLVEPSTTNHLVRSILLTNDLTEAVMDEAIQKNSNMILSYHPPIFSPLKTLTKKSWKERVVLKAIENKIAIYSPHTAFDAAKGGVNDWLASGLGKGTVEPLQNTLVDGQQGSHRVPLPDTGVGRLCTLEEAVSVETIVKRIKNHLKLNNIRFASACSGNDLVKTVAICAGSGGSVLKGVKADMYLTGEMSHHDVLDAVSNGIHVILGEHSNTERGFFKEMFSSVLDKMLDGNVAIHSSTIDVDPIQIV